MNGIFGTLDYLLDGGAVVILWLPDMDDMLGVMRRLLVAGSEQTKGI